MEPAAVVDALGREQRDFLDLVGSLSESELARPSLCKGWSVKDVLVHTMVGERDLFHDNVRRALAGDAAPQPGFDLEAVNNEQIQANRRRSGEDLVAEACTVVDETARMLGSLPAADFERPSWNPIAPGTLGFYVKGRIWEWWTHGQDVRVPLRRPGGREPDRVRPVVEVIRDGIEAVFIPERSRGVRVSYAFQVGDVGFTIRIDDGTCRVDDFFDPKATTRVNADPATFCLVGTRRIPQMRAVLTGRFRPSGNLVAGLRFLGYFRAP